MGNCEAMGGKPLAEQLLKITFFNSDSIIEALAFSSLVEFIISTVKEDEEIKVFLFRMDETTYLK